MDGLNRFCNSTNIVTSDIIIRFLNGQNQNIKRFSVRSRRDKHVKHLVGMSLLLILQNANVFAMLVLQEDALKHKLALDFIHTFICTFICIRNNAIQF